MQMQVQMQMQIRMQMVGHKAQSSTVTSLTFRGCSCIWLVGWTMTLRDGLVG